MSEHLYVITEWPLRVGWEREFLERRLLAAGIYSKQIQWRSILASRPYAGLFARASEAEITAGITQLQGELGLAGPTTLLLLGEGPLKHLSGRSGIDKWQASAFRVNGSWVIPSLPMERIAQNLSLQVWLSLSCRKAASALRGELKEPKYDFLLNPPLEEAMAFLDRVAHAERASFDIETGRGQINTVGFAISPTEAIAINVLPDRLSAQNFKALFGKIAQCLESDSGPRLVLQNFIYETLFLSRYGIRLNNVDHDTMICQKFLWPEFEMGLDAVGRMYTDMPYWKDDGKSWNNIRDWGRHYEYNCKDTVGTYAGYLGQNADLQKRGLSEIYSGYIAKLFPCVAEMCCSGIPVSRDKLTALRADIEGEYAEALSALRAEAGATDLNPRSPAQVKKFFLSEPRGYAIPKKYDSKTKKYKESTDEKSLKKLRMKYPEDAAIPALLKLSRLGKLSSSYLNFGYDTDGRMRYSLIAGGTETMRMTGYCDPWDNGVNPQTVPSGSKGTNVKAIFEAAPGKLLLQCDLRQAESRFVAYDAADLNLITALEDTSRDIHSEVAAEICLALGKDPTIERRDASNWKKRWRQLGKKSGHGANYSMKEQTFIESCIQEMDLVLSKVEANKVLEAYHTLFPGIRRWHANIRREVAQERKLRTPWGWERYFYSRLDDDMFRQAYAFRPQSTIPFIVNQLMLSLCQSRERGVLDFSLLLQCHDSILLEIPESALHSVARACLSVSEWHPDIRLPGGKLVIPTEVEVGQNWGELRGYEE